MGASRPVLQGKPELGSLLPGALDVPPYLGLGALPHRYRLVWFPVKFMPLDIPPQLEKGAMWQAAAIRRKLRVLGPSAQSWQ